MGQKGEKEILTASRGAGRRWKEKAAAVKGNFLELGGRRAARSIPWEGWKRRKEEMLFSSVAGECWKRKVCVCSACLRKIKRRAKNYFFFAVTMNSRMSVEGLKSANLQF